MQKVRGVFGSGFISAIYGDWDFRSLLGADSVPLSGGGGGESRGKEFGSNPAKFSGFGHLLEGPEICFKIEVGV